MCDFCDKITKEILEKKVKMRFNKINADSESEINVEAVVRLKIAETIKQIKEWERGAIKTSSFVGCSDAMAFAYKLCYELLESKFKV